MTSDPQAVLPLAYATEEAGTLHRIGRALLLAALALGTLQAATAATQVWLYVGRQGLGIVTPSQNWMSTAAVSMDGMRIAGSLLVAIAAVLCLQGHNWSGLLPLGFVVLMAGWLLRATLTIYGVLSTQGSMPSGYPLWPLLCQWVLSTLGSSIIPALYCWLFWPWRRPPFFGGLFRTAAR